MLRAFQGKTRGKDKVLVIGLDGVPCRIIKNFIKMGIMPCLGKLSQQGTMREMISSIPPVSSVAWTNFFTGVNPGKHGIYGFMERQCTCSDWMWFRISESSFNN